MVRAGRLHNFSRRGRDHLRGSGGDSSLPAPPSPGPAIRSLWNRRPTGGSFRRPKCSASRRWRSRTPFATGPSLDALEVVLSQNLVKAVVLKDPPVGRRFQSDRIAGPGEGAQAEMNRLQSPAGDHDLVGRNRAAGPHIPWRVPAGVERAFPAVAT